MDPLAPDYPWYTPYQFAGNGPIMNIDLDGQEPKSVVGFKEATGSLKGLNRPVIFLFKEINGVPERISEAASIVIDQWYHDNITGYSYGAITLGNEIIYTETYRTSSTRSFLELSSHEIIHVVQFHRDFNEDLSSYLISYGLSSVQEAIKNRTIDADKLHDKIPAEQEANIFENQFDFFLEFHDETDEKGRRTGNNPIINILEKEISDDEKIELLQP